MNIMLMLIYLQTKNPLPEQHICNRQGLFLEPIQLITLYHHENFNGRRREARRGKYPPPIKLERSSPRIGRILVSMY